MIGGCRSELGRRRRRKLGFPPMLLYDPLDAGFRKAHRVVLDCTMIDWDDVRYFLAAARRLGAGCRRAARGESFNCAAAHRPARGTPRGADVRKAAFGLPPDGS